MILKLIGIQWVLAKLNNQNDPAIINDLKTKEERRVDIILKRKSKSSTKTITLTEQKNKKITLLKQKRQLKWISELKIKQFNGNTFIEYKIEDNFMRGFEGVEKFKFQPCFYSQTPEDFHRRLTFYNNAWDRVNLSILDMLNSNNSVFGRQPYQFLRIGVFFHTKVFLRVCP